MYKFSNNGRNLILSAKSPGNYTFFVQAKSDFGSQIEYIEYKLVISPCDASVDIIKAPSDFSKVAFFKSVDSKSEEVTFEVGFDKVSKDDLKANKAKLLLPIFKSTYGTECPLSYYLSSNSKKFANYTDLSINSTPVKESIEVSMNLSTSANTFEFYVQARNPFDAVQYS